MARVHPNRKPTGPGDFRDRISPRVAFQPMRFLGGVGSMTGTRSTATPGWLMRPSAGGPLFVYCWLLLGGSSASLSCQGSGPRSHTGPATRNTAAGGCCACAAGLPRRGRAEAPRGPPRAQPAARRGGAPGSVPPFQAPSDAGWSGAAAPAGGGRPRRQGDRPPRAGPAHDSRGTGPPPRPPPERAEARCRVGEGGGEGGGARRLMVCGWRV